MKQKQINTIVGALNGITKAIGGATQHGAAIGLTHNNTASLTGKKTGLVNSEGAQDAAKTVLATRQSAMASVLLTAIAFITLARDMFKPRFGNSHSAAWAVVGFISSLRIPRTMEQVKFKLQKIVTFLTATPDAESAEKNITATRAQEILNELVTKENEVTAQRTIVRNAVNAKKSAFKAVVKALSNLAGELKGLVLPTDPIYLSFGLNIPGAQAIPSVPTNLIAVLIGATAAALKWDRAERAERYRIYKKVVGVDTDFVLVETRDDLDFVLEGLPANATTQVAVAAVNSGGESAMSEAVTIVTV